MTTEKKKIKRITLADKDAILKFYKDGLNGVEIHALLPQIPYSGIIYYLKKVKTRRGGVEAAEKENLRASGKIRKSGNWNRRAIPQDKVDILVDCKARGLNPTHAAKKAGVSVNTAQRYMDRFSANEATRREVPTSGTPSLEKKIMEAEMRLQILREMRDGK